MKLSANFDSSEFSCHDGTAVPDELMDDVQLLVDGICQPVRDRAGELEVVSGYRTEAYNTKIGGAKKSMHVKARAADIKAKSLSVKELHDLILEMKLAGKLPRLGGLGYYPGKWVHVDSYQAGDGHLRRWTGGGIGAEQ